MYKKLKNKLNKAVVLREEGDLAKARKLFEILLKDAEKLLKKDPSKELKSFYVDLQGQYVIQHRLEAKRLQFNALELGKELLKYDKNNKINNPLSIRSVSNTLIDMRLYEQAVPYLKKLIKMYKGNKAKQGDTKSHLAYCLFRMGKIRRAEKLIDEAVKDIKDNMPTGKKTTWYIAALMLKAMILNYYDKNKEAIALAKEACRIAEKEKLDTRIRQSKSLLDFLEGKVSS